MAIISGAFGLAAFACLIVFLVMRPSDQRIAQILLRGHDVGVIVQCLCLIPFALALAAIVRRHSHGSSRVMAATAVSFLALVVVLMLLSFANVAADVLYMIPQGAVGAWLIVVCWKFATDLPKGLRRLGIVAGVGLMLISIFPLGYALFVDSAILHGPISDDDPAPPGTETADGIVHAALAIGTLIGCTAYPIWTALAGRWLLLRGGK
ncbi:hypothetical protein SNE35_14545 [Paucibacter sp. R3-3]|uniref:Cytochrome c oxidase assembly protein n=1 Tax=Roseateles agri TaxID=3098619 RepID=A0ABU5DHH4_9BURK|nr:hypothetical protein [Paucibacter sp. R3-3]MDY0745736.1 hypothetical protein [Paucibacter sp. R3-3]